MLSLRTLLRTEAPGAGDAAVLAACHADAVLLDLATPRDAEARAQHREAVLALAAAITRAGRATLVRLSDTRGGLLDGDLDAAVHESVAAVILSGAEVPQDARDADVAIRHREMTLGIVPGTVRLVLEIDSAAGLAALPSLVSAVDRTDVLSLRLSALLRDLRGGAFAGTTFENGGAAPQALIDHTFATIAQAAAAAGLPWLLFAPGGDDHAPLATRAHDFGATGVVIGSDAAAAGLTSLYTPDPKAVRAAQATRAEWLRLRSEQASGNVSSVITTPLGPRTVDRRSQRQAQFLIDLAAAIERREAAR